MISIERWHKWFAWYPVRIKGQWHWLSYVERKGTYYTDIDYGWWEWEYRK